MRGALRTCYLHRNTVGCFSSSSSRTARRCSAFHGMQRHDTGADAAADSEMLSHGSAAQRQEGEEPGVATSTRRSQSPLDHVRGPAWQRRKSDAATPKEVMVFQRDHSYAKKRPLPTLPWLQLAEKTYLDDAERIYGRLRHWENRYSDQPERRDELQLILKQALRDLRRQIAVERRSALRYQRLCDQRQAEYRSYLVAGLSNPALLRRFAAESLEKAARRGKREDTVPIAGEADEEKEGGAQHLHGEPPHAATEEDEHRRLEWRMRGANAQLADTVALRDLSERDANTVPSYSSYPFLRKRAQDRADTLDPSLLDWSAKYFPNDDDRTFDLPPSLAATEKGTTSTSIEARAANQSQGAAAAAEGDTTSTHGGDEASSVVPAVPGSRRAKNRLVGRRSLRLPLRIHRNTTMGTFDGEGLFFAVKEPSASDDDDAERSSGKKTPKPITPDTFFRPHAPAKQRKVVKVDYDTVLLARQTRKSPEVHRARERLIRLTRGEPIDTV